MFIDFCSNGPHIISVRGETMRLMASSNPDDVDRDKALHLLTERAVLTRAVCRELLDSGGVFNGRRPFAALALLSQWVDATFFPQDDVPSLSAVGGLDDMVVPEDCEDLMREIRDGAEVCDLLILHKYGDTCDYDSDREAIAKSLDAYWKAHAQIVHTPERWAVDLASLRANASNRIT
jgi:hypothetical protein